MTNKTICFNKIFIEIDNLSTKKEIFSISQCNLIFKVFNFFLKYNIYNQNVSLIEFKMNNNYLIYAYNSSIFLNEMKISNITIANFLVYLNNENNNLNKVEITDSLLNEIYINSSKIQNNALFYIKSIDYINISNTLFTFIIKPDYIFEISHIKKGVIVSNISFINNTIKYQLMNIEYTPYLQMMNIICSFLNKLIILNDFSFGGCFRTSNILNRLFFNISIGYSYSDKTTIGIKVIDNPISLKSLEAEANYMYEKKVKI